MAKVSLARALWFAVWRSLMVEGGPLHNLPSLYQCAPRSREETRERGKQRNTHHNTLREQRAFPFRFRFLIFFLCLDGVEIAWRETRTSVSALRERLLLLQAFICTTYMDPI